MSLIIILMMVIAVIFFIKSHVNKYSAFFFVMITTLSLSMYLLLLFLGKKTNYFAGAGFLADPDFILYYLIENLPISYYSVIRIFNITSAIYFVALYYFVIYYFEDFRSVNKRFVHILSIIPISMFGLSAWFYDPTTCYRFYLAIMKDTSDSVRNIVYAADLAYYIFVICYMVILLGYILKCGRKSRNYLRRKQSWGMFICVLMCNIVLIMIFSMNIFRRVYIFNEPTILIRIISNNSDFSVYMPVLCLLLAVVAAMFFIVQQYDLTQKNDAFKMRMARKNVLRIDKDMVSIFHSFKNIVFSHLILVRKAQMEDGEAREVTLGQLEAKLSAYVEELSHMLNMERNIDISTEQYPVISVIETALEKINTGDIKIVREYEYKNINAVIDNFYMTEAVSNIILNAVEAIEKAERDGVITFRVYNEYEWTVIEISDNGTGIRRRDIRKIQKPFYTTKSRITNWGIGLSHTYNIIKKHGGHIYITSRPGTGTTVSILLPQQSR